MNDDPVWMTWSPKTLTELEGDWGEPTYSSYVVTNSHALRKKPLREFTPEDLRFMLGQQISLPTLMPMALDVLADNPFVGGDMCAGALLHSALRVDKQFWQDHQQLWYRLSMVLVDLHALREYMDKELLPAAERFEAAFPTA